MANKLRHFKNVYHIFSIIIISLICNESIAKEKHVNYIEIKIFRGFFLIPNDYTFNVPMKKHTEDFEISSFSQYEKKDEPLLVNPGVISMGNVNGCEVCINPSILNQWKVKHRIRQVGKLTQISAKVKPPGSSKSTMFIFIFDKDQFIEIQGGNLEFIDKSLEYYQRSVEHL